MNKEQAEEMLELLEAIKINTGHIVIVTWIIAFIIVVVALSRLHGYL